MRVAVHQPNYLPWPGFFHKLANCDVFVILDNVQYPRRQYCNRARIKTREGPSWLTLPVEGGPITQEIRETRISDSEKNLKRHIKTICHCYSRAPYGDILESVLKILYNGDWEFLLPLNLVLIQVLADIFSIKTPMILASALGEFPGVKSERIIYICQQLGADTYLSGRGGEAYNDLDAFRKAGIKLEYQTFIPPVYPQGSEPFYSGLSVIDLIAYTGKNSCRFLDRSFIE